VAIWKDRLKPYYLQLISWFTPTLPEPEEELTLQQQCELILENLNVDWFKNYTMQKGVGTILFVPFPTIDVYIDALHERSEIIQLNQQVLADHCRWTASAVKINDFFVTHDGYYQDVQLVVRHFRQASLLLCKALRDAADATPSAAAYNLRLISPLLINIKDIAITLTEISNRA
jgi:hypothetical protein